MKARNTTLEERVEIVKYCLDHDKDYKGTSSKFSVPYSLVYQWVRRYEKDSETGLSYSRKGPKPKKIGTTETLEAKYEKLQRELERVKFENEVLKKNNISKNFFTLQSQTRRKISDSCVL